MKDVARLAGVSTGTVSHALNRPEKVSEQSLRRVQAAVEKLGFVRNSAASSLAAGHSKTIGLVLTNIANSLFVEIARGAENVAQQAGYAVLLADSDLDAGRQDNYLHVFTEARVAGILLAPMDASLERIDGIRRHGPKLVLVNYAGGRNDCCSVLTDEEHGGYIAARHLIESGRKRLLFAGGPDWLHAIHERVQGARRAVSEAGGAVSLEVIPSPSLSSEEGQRIGKAIAARPGDLRPDGILCPSDRIASGLLFELAAGKVGVPDEVAVTGYDNNQFAMESGIPITTVSQGGHEMGAQAMTLLLEEIEEPSNHAHRSLILKPRLIRRKSS